MALVPFGSGKRSKREAKGAKRKARMPGKTGSTRDPNAPTALHLDSGIDGSRRGHFPGRPYKVR